MTELDKLLLSGGELKIDNELSCSYCGQYDTPVIVFDTSGGEYAKASICLKCLRRFLELNGIDYGLIYIREVGNKKQ